jgi:sec-independent protein translocase protein TatA
LGAPVSEGLCMFRNPLIDAVVVLLVVLLIFGPKRLPGLGRGLGQGMKEFKDGITGKASVEEDEEQPVLSPGNAPEPPVPSPPSAEVGSSERRS